MKLRPKLMIGIGVPLLLAFFILGLIIRTIAINSIETSTAAIMRETASRCEMALDDFIGWIPSQSHGTTRRLHPKI